MNNSMISAMVSMNAMQQRLDVIADNIANVDTVGYKSKDTSFEDVLTQVQGHHKDFALAGRSTPSGYTMGFGTRLASIVENLAQGSHKETGNPLDLAIEGNAMFAVQGNGGIAYTREGGFHVSPDPQNAAFVNLVNNQGYQVLDRNNNPIRIPANAKVAVDGAGQVLAETAAGRNVVGVLKLAELQRPDGLVKMDGNLYMLAAGLTEAQVFEATQTDPTQLKSEVQSGFLEQSNVSMSDEMTKIMEVQRAYQLAARALSSSDTMMNLANTMRG